MRTGMTAYRLLASHFVLMTRRHPVLRLVGQPAIARSLRPWHLRPVQPLLLCLSLRMLVHPQPHLLDLVVL